MLQSLGSMSGVKVPRFSSLSVALFFLSLDVVAVFVPLKTKGTAVCVHLITLQLNRVTNVTNM